MKAPMYHNGKVLVFEEVFRSPFTSSTKAQAERVLNDIRAAHPENRGWVELEAYIECTPSGYRAVRHHAKYEFIR